MSGYPQNRLITLWRIGAELLVSPLAFPHPTDSLVPPVMSARLQLTAARCQCAASGRTRDGRRFRSGPASL